MVVKYFLSFNLSCLVTATIGPKNIFWLLTADDNGAITVDVNTKFVDRFSYFYLIRLLMPTRILGCPVCEIYVFTHILLKLNYSEG